MARMEIRVTSLLEGARQAEGTVVIIDVYRAFTTAAVAFLRKAEKIALVAEVDEAFALRDQWEGALCMGEVDGKRPEGFEFGNSPFELTRADVAGKTLIQSTRAGSTGIVAAEKAERIYAASFVVAEATAQAVKRNHPEIVTLVAMGREGVVRTDEDEQCALYIRNLLQARWPDREAVRHLVLMGEDSLKFEDPDQPQFHRRDRDIALRIDSVPFAIEVTREDGFLVARPQTVEEENEGSEPAGKRTVSSRSVRYGYRSGF